MTIVSRWARKLNVLLILIVLALAVGAPVVVDGYLDEARARTAFASHDLAGAGHLYVLAAQRLPWKPELWDEAAFSYALANDWSHATPLFEYASQRGLLSANSWILYGYGYWDGRGDKTMEIWSSGLQQYPKAYMIYYWFAWANMERRDYAAEQQALETWLSSGKGGAGDHYRLGQLLLTSDPGRARQELQLASTMAPGYVSAVQTLETSMALASAETDKAKQFIILARGLGLINEWPLAESVFQQAVDADRNNAEAWAWLGEAQQQNNEDGKQALDSALSLDPHDPLVHGMRALYWNRQQDHVSELAEYLAAAGLEPNNPEWQAAVGDAYTSNGDLVSALASYQNATTLAPENAKYWSRLASFCADNGVQVLEVGLPAAKKAAELAPKDPAALDALGWSYAQAGLLYNAEQTLLKATSLPPDLALAHLHLAETYLRKGDTQSALPELNWVLQMDPNGSVGKLASQLLNQYSP